MRNSRTLLLQYEVVEEVWVLVFPRHSQTNFIMEKLSLYYCYLVLSINYIDTYSQSYHSYHSHQVNNHPYHYIQPDSNNFLSNYIGKSEAFGTYIK